MPDKTSSLGDGAVSARQFWARFHAAVRGNDVAELASLTRVPFQVRGQLDEDAPQQLGESELREMFPKLLNEDTGLQENGQTMRALIGATTSDQFAGFVEDGGSIHLGIFEFELTEHGWFLVRAFVRN